MVEDEDSTPQEIQRLFGAGIKRKRVEFVPAAASEPVIPSNQSLFTSENYLSIVLKNGASSIGLSTTDAETSNPAESPPSQQTALKATICEICHLPLQASDDTTKPHEASIAHQVCLQHSHPPSHLDRERQGLKYLSSYGWDPDSRLGLGATGEGIRVPIKAKMKNDKAGLGAELEELERAQEKKVETLDAKQARKKDLEDRRKREKLQEMFYGSGEVERYFGGG